MYLKSMNLLQEILIAEKRVRKHIDKTPLIHSPYLSEQGNCNVYLKSENLQKTGSFKIRGAFNAILSLYEEQNITDFVTSSSGNHGNAFAHVIQELNLNGLIFLPENASQAKTDTLKECSSEIRFYGTDCVETEVFARNFALEQSLPFISPYNDVNIIAGQGTIGVELEEDLAQIDCVFVPIGGGGLISGIACYMKNKRDAIHIIGCQPQNSPVMYESIKAGTIIEMKSEPTLSDGTAGGIEPNSITFDFCKKYVDDYELVTEDEIKNAIRLVMTEHNMIIEGAGALSIAAFLKKKDEFIEKTVVLVISGSKINPKEFNEIISK